MLRSAMIPTDFSNETSLILRFAEGLPALGTGRVVLGHVVDASGMEGPVIAAKIDAAREQIRSLTARLVDAGLEVEVRVGAGDPVQGLLAIAAESGVDTIVCGSHGKSILTKLFVGSVSEQLVVEADIPTMLIRYDLLRTREEPGLFSRGFGKQVILPTDFSESSARALAAATLMPKGAIGMLYLLHVIDSGLSGEKLRRAQEEAGAKLDTMCETAAEAGLTARTIIRQGDPVRSTLQQVAERRMTGIIVGTRGQNPLQEAVLGSTSMTLVRQASCPVMIVP